ncbi:hypothetical protein [Arthrobacter sp. Soil763]|uniref:hypothetical protein n=1 Tax=Arthrobacter sp. Soil763 TaxID=1736402 RepID=UPI0006FB369B|nr:hypothetical protein [Arthrobacter sp. Soil763]KRE79978.1 hypothetical protein ASG71_08055 [Arthrobacter sp. Soil763]
MDQLFQFTKDQAEKAARVTIINYYERYPNEWQDEDVLAYEISGMLGIRPQPSYVANALQALDDLRNVENGTHDALNLNEARTEDNRAELVERFEMDLLMAIRDVVAEFRTHEVFVPAAVAA